MALGNSRHPLLPPDIQGKSIRLLDRIRAMPVIGGQPLPLWVHTRPAFRRSPLPVQIRTMSVGYVVAFLCQPSMSRFGKGRVSSPVNNRAFGGAMKPHCLTLKASKVREGLESAPAMRYIFRHRGMTFPEVLRSRRLRVNALAAVFFSKAHCFKRQAPKLQSFANHDCKACKLSAALKCQPPANARRPIYRRPD